MLSFIFKKTGGGGGGGGGQKSCQPSAGRGAVGVSPMCAVIGAVCVICNLFIIIVLPQFSVITTIHISSTPTIACLSIPIHTIYNPPPAGQPQSAGLPGCYRAILSRSNPAYFTNNTIPARRVSSFFVKYFFYIVLPAKRAVLQNILIGILSTVLYIVNVYRIINYLKDYSIASLA
ncbi:hypothetical protein R80B4_00841 [Fibrobacteres bacterium R8-0-B4]